MFYFFKNLFNESIMENDENNTFAFEQYWNKHIPIRIIQLSDAEFSGMSDGQIQDVYFRWCLLDKDYATTKYKDMLIQKHSDWVNKRETPLEDFNDYYFNYIGRSKLARDTNKGTLLLFEWKKRIIALAVFDGQGEWTNQKLQEVYGQNYTTRAIANHTINRYGGFYKIKKDTIAIFDPVSTYEMEDIFSSYKPNVTRCSQILTFDRQTCKKLIDTLKDKNLKMV